MSLDWILNLTDTGYGYWGYPSWSIFTSRSFHDFVPIQTLCVPLILRSDVVAINPAPIFRL